MISKVAFSLMNVGASKKMCVPLRANLVSVRPGILFREKKTIHDVIGHIFLIVDFYAHIKGGGCIHLIFIRPI